MPSDLSPTDVANQLSGAGATLNQPYDPDLWIKAQRDAYNRTMRQTALDAALRHHPHPSIDAKAVLETARRFHRFLTA